MKRNKINGVIFVVTILSFVFTTGVSARIIPAAEQAKTNAEPYLHTVVIDASWELNLPDNSVPPTVPTANGKTIPALDKGKPNEHATPYEHSPAVGPGWVLTVPPNPTGVDTIGIDTSFGLGGTVLEPLGGIQYDITGQLEVPFESSSITVVPEPSMLILFSLGTFLVRRKR